MVQEFSLGSRMGERIRMRRARARLVAGKSWRTEMGGLVSRQALHKYEKGQTKPGARVLVQLARALGVPSAHLAFESPTRVSLVAYRKGASLGKAQQEQIEARVTLAVQERVRLQTLLGQTPALPRADDGRHSARRRKRRRVVARAVEFGQWTQFVAFRR